MIYPPTGSQGPQADQTPNRDPDRQLALMLVVLAVATAMLFYAAELGPRSLIEYLKIDALLGDRFGLGTGSVTDTLPVDLTPPPEEPTEDAYFGGFDDVVTPATFPTQPLPTLAIATPTRPALITTPTNGPLPGEGWPSPELPPPGSLPTSTKGSGSGYPGLTPGATSGYPSPGSPTRGPSPDASGRMTATPSPGES